MPTPEPPPISPRRIPRLRRSPGSSRKGFGIPLGPLLVAVLIALLVYKLFMESDGGFRSEIVDLAGSVERIQELSTVRSHLRFAVVVREESGNIVVRRLAENDDRIGMTDLGSALFHDPTMIVGLHGIATYGVRLNDLRERVRQDDASVTVRLPDAELLDVRLVADDTRIVAQMKGLFRSSNDELLLEAQRKGEEFTRRYALEDTSLLDLAARRAREALTLLVQGSGKKVIFE